MKRFVFLLCMALATAPALAVDHPRGTAFDTRIQYVNYNVDDVVQVNSYPGISTQIVFAPGEVVLDDGMSSGFSQGWQVATSRNSVYVKPQSVKLSDNTIMQPTPDKWSTDLTVTTNRHVYSFFLVLHSGKGDVTNNPSVAFRITFRYPADDAAKAQLAAAKEATREKMDAGSKPTPVNWHYSMQLGKKSESIAPTMAYDDGRFTYLRFPGNRDFPAAFAVADDGSESIVNTHIDPAHPDVLVIHMVARRLVLRLGKEVVGVYNDDFDPEGKPATTGTTIRGVERTIRDVNAKGADQ